MRRGNYPDWLWPHLSKGVYVNKTVNGYTLYRGHTVYDPVKKRAKRICDEILGRVTESEGFIPKKSYNKPLPQFTIYTYGVYKVVLDLVLPEISIMSDEFIDCKNEIIVSSILQYINNQITIEDYNNSYLSIIYPKFRFSLINGEKISLEINRTAKKISNILSEIDIKKFNYIYLVKYKNTFQVMGLTNELYKLSNTLGVDLTYEKR